MDFGEEWLASHSKPLDIRKSPDAKLENSSNNNTTITADHSKMVSPSKPNDNENEEDLFKTINELYKNVIQNNSSNDLDIVDRYNTNYNDNHRNDYQPTTTNRLHWNSTNNSEKENENNSEENQQHNNNNVTTNANKSPRRRVRKQKSKKYNEHTQEYESSSLSSSQSSLSSSDEDELSNSKESIDKNQKKKKKNETEKLTNSQEDLVSELKSILENVSFDWRNIKVDHNNDNKNKKEKHDNNLPLTNGNHLNETSDSENDEDADDDDDDDDDEYWHFKIEHNNSPTNNSNDGATQNNTENIFFKMPNTNRTRSSTTPTNSTISHNRSQSKTKTNEKHDAEPQKRRKLNNNNNNNKDNYMTTSSDENDEDEEFYHFKIEQPGKVLEAQTRDATTPTSARMRTVSPITNNSTNILVEEENKDDSPKKSKKVLEDPGFDWSAIEDTKDSETETDTGISSSTPKPIITFESEGNFDKQSDNYGTTDIETISTDNDNDDEEFWHFEIENSKAGSVVEMDKKLSMGIKSEEGKVTTLPEDDEDNTYNEYDTITSNSNYRSVSKPKSTLEDEGFDWDFYETQDENTPKHSECEIEDIPKDDEQKNDISEQSSETISTKPTRRNWVEDEEPWWFTGEENNETNESSDNKIDGKKSEKTNEEINIIREEEMENVEKENKDENIAVSTIPIRRNWTEAEPWWLAEDPEITENGTNDLQKEESDSESETITVTLKATGNSSTEHQEDDAKEQAKTTPLRRNETENSAWWLNEEMENDANNTETNSENVNSNHNNIESKQQSEATEDSFVQEKKLYPVRRNWTEEGAWWLDEEDSNENKTNDDTNTNDNNNIDIRSSDNDNLKDSKDENNINEDLENKEKTNPIRRNWTEEAPWWLDENNDTEENDTNEVTTSETETTEKNEILEDNTETSSANIQKTGLASSNKEKIDNNNDNTIKYVKRNWSGETSWWGEDITNDKNNNENDHKSNDNISNKLEEIKRSNDNSEIYDTGDEEWVYEEVSEEETDESYDSDEISK